MLCIRGAGEAGGREVDRRDRDRVDLCRRAERHARKSLAEGAQLGELETRPQNRRGSASLRVQVPGRNAAPPGQQTEGYILCL